MREQSVTGFLRDFVEQHTIRSNRPFCWILGAGASVGSGIPSAGKLARLFLERLCENATGSIDACDRWMRSGELRIDGFDPLDPAKHYPELYERCFGDCPDVGYAFLEDVMHEKRPSYGYAVLALILEKTHHRIVITTNFDNLVADALFMHSAIFPRVVGHAQLTEFVQTALRRPLIAKIHGDLGFRTKNTPTEIATLDDSWRGALRKVFQSYTPVVIGYGGNDHSLMDFLGELPPAIPDRVYWCQWEKEQPSQRVTEFLAGRQNAVLVRHAGFDALLMQLEDRLRETDLKLPIDLAASLAQRQGERLDEFRRGRESLARELFVGDLSFDRGQRETRAEAKELRAQSETVARALVGEGAPGAESSSVKWALKILAAPTTQERDRVYRAAIGELPKAAHLLAGYAVFLCYSRRDRDRAEVFYKRAIEADPENAQNLVSYATFLHQQRGDLAGAEKLYQRAIDANPGNARNLATYALFRQQGRGDLDGAEKLYERAVAVEPRNADILCNYAMLLKARSRLDRAQEFYERAVAVEPRNADNLVTYAVFLQQDRGELDRAQEFYERAVDADPRDADNLGIYAFFLQQVRGELDRAQELYERAIQVDPRHANSLGACACLLWARGRALERAQALFERAIDADPRNAVNLGNYAVFLRQERREIDRAEKLFERAIEADPRNASWPGGLALLLHKDRRDLAGAEALYRRAIAADPTHANNLGNFAQLLLGAGRRAEGTETLAAAFAGRDPGAEVLSELWFYAYAHCTERWPDALARLKGLLEADARSRGWDLSANVARARADGNREADLVAALADVIGGSADVATLERFPAWRTTKAIPPDAPR